MFLSNLIVGFVLLCFSPLSSVFLFLKASSFSEFDRFAWNSDPRRQLRERMSDDRQLVNYNLVDCHTQLLAKRMESVKHLKHIVATDSDLEGAIVARNLRRLQGRWCQVDFLCCNLLECFNVSINQCGDV